MAGQEVFMDVPAVQGLGNKFGDISEVLTQVSNAMEALMTVLKITAFIGFFGGKVIEMFLEQLKPIIDKLAEQCGEMATDLAASAQAYQNGDAQGGTRFH